MASKINNLKVTMHHADRLDASWNDGNARYHFWFDRANVQPQRGTIYKNPLQIGLKTFDPGYFRTRHLDANSAAWRHVVGAVVATILSEKLIEAAEREYQAKENAEERDRQETIARHRKEQAGPNLYAALKELREASIAATVGDRNAALARLELAEAAAKIALDKAEGN